MTKKQYRELVEKVTKGLLTCMDNSTEACRECPYWRGEDGKWRRKDEGRRAAADRDGQEVRI